MLNNPSKCRLTICCFALFFFLVLNAQAQTSFETTTLRCELDETGRVKALIDRSSGINYVPDGHAGYLIRLKLTNKQELSPQRMQQKGDQILLSFANGLKLELRVNVQPAYLSFQLLRCSDSRQINTLLWGPLNTSIRDTIGEVVGVVRNPNFAIGIQALNAKTIGGKQQGEDGTTASSAGITGSTATSETHGSSLQAFCLNAALPRQVDVLHMKANTVRPIPNYTLEGSAIALFGVPNNQALQTIGTISQKEKLPYQTIDGQWIRTSPKRNRPYLITNFSEANFDELLDLTRRLGFYSIYHEGPFNTWGHFELEKTQFPNGPTGMKRSVEKASAAGIKVGVHTLTNFISTNDAFVSPTPSTGLLSTNSSVLSEAISADTKDIPIADLAFFDFKSTLNCVQIGTELIRYQEISKEGVPRLLNCQRGAFGTIAQAFPRGASIKRLADHGYKTLFPDWQLQEKMIQNLANFFNETGVSHLDFDGHEGALYTGYGDYGTNYWVDQFMKKVDHPVFNGSSIMNHYYWHHNSYINWGEPWYASFRESQADHRFRLQPFFERNYMPNMLGWFLVTPTTTVEDVEWMMSVSAGYNAGFALVLRYEALKKNPNIDSIIATIARWEQAKQLGIFNPTQRALLKNTKNDFHLTHEALGNWQLQHYDKFRFEHQARALQPGEPQQSVWTFNNKQSTQQMHLYLHADGKEGNIVNPILEMDGFFEIKLPITLQSGEALLWDGSDTIKYFNAKSVFVRNLNIGKSMPLLKTGPHQIVVSAEQINGEHTLLKGVVRLKGIVEKIQH
jgi:hypothetical protein